MNAARRRAADVMPAGGGSAALRGALLIALAVVLGVALLANSFDNDGGTTPIGPGNGDAVDDNGDDGDDGGDGTDDTTEPAPPPTHAVAEVTVRAMNGSGTAGVARSTTDRLIALGYTTGSAGNAPDSPNVATSAVYYIDGFEGDALAIASALGLTDAAVQAMPTPPPVPEGDLQGAQVIMTIGADFPTGTSDTTDTTATGN